MIAPLNRVSPSLGNRSRRQVTKENRWAYPPVYEMRCTRKSIRSKGACAETTQRGVGVLAKLPQVIRVVIRHLPVDRAEVEMGCINS